MARAARRSRAAGVICNSWLSFRSLDVEQIGYVYEGLLEATGAQAGETMLGLKGDK